MASVRESRLPAALAVTETVQVPPRAAIHTVRAEAGCSKLPHPGGVFDQANSVAPGGSARTSSGTRSPTTAALRGDASHRISGAPGTAFPAPTVTNTCAGERRVTSSEPRTCAPLARTSTSWRPGARTSDPRSSPSPSRVSATLAPPALATTSGKPEAWEKTRAVTTTTGRAGCGSRAR